MEESPKVVTTICVNSSGDLNHNASSHDIVLPLDPETLIDNA